MEPGSSGRINTQRHYPWKPQSSHLSPGLQDGANLTSTYFSAFRLCSMWQARVGVCHSEVGPDQSFMFLRFNPQDLLTTAIPFFLILILFYFIAYERCWRDCGGEDAFGQWHTLFFWVPACLFITGAIMVPGELQDLTVPHRSVWVNSCWCSWVTEDTSEQRAGGHHERTHLQTSTQAWVDLQGMGMQRQTMML